MKMEQTECSETSAYKFKTPGNHPKESIQHCPQTSSFYKHLTTCLWRWNRQSVPKRRHINLRRRGITQKKAYNRSEVS